MKKKQSKQLNTQIMKDYKFKDAGFKKVAEIIKKESATNNANLVKMQKRTDKVLAAILKMISKGKK